MIVLMRSIITRLTIICLNLACDPFSKRKAPGNGKVYDDPPEIFEAKGFTSIRYPAVLSIIQYFF